MRNFSFENLDAYKSSMELVDKVYNLISKFPGDERYALSDQLRRAVISVPSNIAEGAGRMSLKEKIRFLEISYGSLMEAYCQLQIAFKRQYITENEYNTINFFVKSSASKTQAVKPTKPIVKIAKNTFKKNAVPIILFFSAGNLDSSLISILSIPKEANT